MFYLHMCIVYVISGLFVLPLRWLMKDLARSDSQLRIHRDLIDEIDRSASEFGLGSPVKHPTFFGVVSPIGSNSTIEAPLSGRPCLAYRVELGHTDKPQLTLFDSWSSKSESIPFLLGDQYHVHIDGDFRFCPWDTEHRITYRIEEFPPSIRRKFLSRTESEDKRLRKHGRLYEWIIPPETPCELVGTPVVDSAHYRSPGILQLQNVRIHVGSRDDVALLDQLRRDRVAAIRGIQEIRRQRRLASLLTLIPVACSIWLFWSLYIATR